MFDIDGTAGGDQKQQANVALHWHFVSLGLRSLDSHCIQPQGTGGEVAGLFGSGTDPAAMVKEVARGITAHGRSKSYHRRGLWAIKAKNGGEVRGLAALPPHPPPPRHLRTACITRSLVLKLDDDWRTSKWMPTVPPVPPQFPVHQKKEQAAAAAAKAPKFYPSEDAPVALKRRNVLKPARLRPSITPGTVRGRPGSLAGSFRTPTRSA